MFPATCNATDDESIVREGQNACYTLQLISQRYEKWNPSLLFLQFATQLFFARRVARRGCYTGNVVCNLPRNAVATGLHMAEKILLGEERLELVGVTKTGSGCVDPGV